MIRNATIPLALAGLLGSGALEAQYASAVVDYTRGANFAPGLTNAASALGEPTRSTPGPFGGPVDPFSPPYAPEHLVSVGTGGSLTVQFAQPIRNSPLNPSGIDFSVFGSAGFLVTNDFDANFNYIGTPATDGTLFNPNTGSTRVSVSADGSTWYMLDPAQAPTVDDLFPTDGSGDFAVPVSPSLRTVSLAGMTLNQVRALYGGSAGGAGYDIDWARTSGGDPVTLDAVSFLRIDVLSGRAEIDGFAAVSAVPEPAVTVLALVGAAALFLHRRQDRSAQSR